MAQFALRTNRNETIYPHVMSKEEKVKLYKDYCAGEVKLVCACNGLCEYRMRANSMAIYPVKHEQQKMHEAWCPKSEIFMKKQSYNAGFLIDDELSEVKVHLSETLMHIEAKQEAGNETVKELQQNRYSNERKYSCTHQGTITISAMIKKMNMLTFRRVAFSLYKDKVLYPKTEVMIRKMYWTEKNTKIGNKKQSVGDWKCNVDGIEFVYKKFLDFMQTNEEKKIVRLIVNEKKKGDYVSVPVYREELNRALDEYEGTYGTRNLKNRNIIISGFRNKYAMYSLRFLLVNDYGLFSESSYEVQMYNAVCEIINVNKYKERGVHFYKPFEYGFGAYADEYLEDGIIEFDGTNKKIIIEVYGRNDEDYLRRKEIKNKMISEQSCIYTYIPWEAHAGEVLPYNLIKESIEDILKELS